MEPIKLIPIDQKIIEPTDVVIRKLYNDRFVFYFPISNIYRKPIYLLRYDPEENSINHYCKLKDATWFADILIDGWVWPNAINPITKITPELFTILNKLAEEYNILREKGLLIKGERKKTPTSKPYLTPDDGIKFLKSLAKLLEDFNFLKFRFLRKPSIVQSKNPLILTYNDLSITLGRRYFKITYQNKTVKVRRSLIASPHYKSLRPCHAWIALPKWLEKIFQ